MGGRYLSGGVFCGASDVVSVFCALSCLGISWKVWGVSEHKFNLRYESVKVVEWLSLEFELESETVTLATFLGSQHAAYNSFERK